MKTRLLCVKIIGQDTDDRDKWRGYVRQVLPPPHTCCQDGARDFFKIDEKVIRRRERVVVNAPRSNGRCQKFFSFAPPTFVTLATP